MSRNAGAGSCSLCPIPQPTHKQEGRRNVHDSVGPSSPLTNNGKSEEQVHSAASRSVLAWQVQPRCRCLQTQPGPLPSWGRGWWWQPVALHCYAWLFLWGESLVSVPESKDPLIPEELCGPDFDLSHIGSLHTPKRTF